MMQTLRERYRPRTLSQLIGNQPAKAILGNMLRRDSKQNSILLYGPKGCGKTSTARILSRTFTCLAREPGAVDPCGECDVCADFDRNWLAQGVRIITRNCASLTLAEVQDDWKDAFGMHSAFVIYYDEYQRMRERIGDLLVTYLEDPNFNVYFIYSTPNLDSVDEAMRQRSLIVELAPPTEPELISLLERVCRDEQIRSDIPVLREICRRAGNAPREALMELERLTLLTGGDLRCVNQSTSASEMGEMGVIRSRRQFLTLPESLNEHCVHSLLG